MYVPSSFAMGDDAVRELLDHHGAADLVTSTPCAALLNDPRSVRGVRLPRMAGEIERRLLVNYRVDPAALTGLLPPQLRPQLVDGMAVAGICLIRLGSLRPRGLPPQLGVTTENAAHRIAVEWEERGSTQAGVFVPRRDSSSRLTWLLGGRVFPGAHHLATFSVEESDDVLQVGFRSQDGTAEVEVRAAVEPTLTGSRLFADVAEASSFFEQGAVGLSPGRDPSRLEAVRLTTHAWKVEPCRIIHSRSSFFDDPARFPPGSAVLDSALVMRRVPVVWNALQDVLTSAG